MLPRQEQENLFFVQRPNIWSSCQEYGVGCHPETPVWTEACYVSQCVNIESHTHIQNGAYIIVPQYGFLVKWKNNVQKQISFHIFIVHHNETASLIQKNIPFVWVKLQIWMFGLVHRKQRHCEQQKHWASASPRLEIHRKIRQVVLYISFLNTVKISWGLVCFYTSTRRLLI